MKLRRKKDEDATKEAVDNQELSPEQVADALDDGRSVGIDDLGVATDSAAAEADVAALTVDEVAETAEAPSKGRLGRKVKAKSDAKVAGSKSKKGLFGKRKKSNEPFVRIEELEARLAEDGIEDFDPETVVSMYMPKRRFKRLGATLLRLDKLQKILLALALIFGVIFALSFLQERMGNFTINLNRLELYRKGISIADNPDFYDATAKLEAEAVINGTNISVNDLPEGLQNADGSHNGTNYMAYTFYLRNAGKENLDYAAYITLVSSAKGAEKAARVKVWRNDEAIVYAAASTDGSAEEGCTSFQSDNIVCSYTEEDFKVGYVDKYTVVIWLEGDDPECVDAIIGGEVEFAMNFQALDHDDSSLFVKFVQDIVDTLTGNNPISSSGNDAPEFYNTYEVTYDSRRNQENPPPGANG